MLVGRDGVDVALRAAKAMSRPTSDLFMFGDLDEDLSHPEVRPWTDILFPPEEVEAWDWHRITTLEEAQHTTAVINYSSGTTGVPKGVELSHYNFAANCEQVLFKRSSIGKTENARHRKRNIDNSGERWLMPLPMYHA